MKAHPWLLPILSVSAVLAFSTTDAADKKVDVLYTSPSGAYRIEETDRASNAENMPVSNIWVVSTKDPSQRAKLPRESGDATPDDEFHFSPNEEWIMGLYHVGSGLRDAHLYHRISPQKVEMVESPFSTKAWEKGVKLGGLKSNYSADGVYAMTFFGGWSPDSHRLLVRLGGGEEKRSFKYGYIYFNTRTKAFEVTDYLRKLSRTKDEQLACAEPTDPLPPEEELKTRFDAADRALNKTYQELIAGAAKQQATNLRDYQRAWIKDRDAALALYLSVSPPAEKERRRLQFLTSATSARIEELNHPPE